ncbi:hypothetical protein K469DRAFT_714867 [Zopfia rhizophila CBS 207.26]|uniref:Uncharacterized protein n=1 Tax=Zopfia rhizophila CBS 207.26 TaxID=1314779 RepID=A0A6A6ENU3_9PEZI|nr:hypothetical protein K469DRAFT_714867 [Zopfia rhizophila CBS 207.26]
MDEPYRKATKLDPTAFSGDFCPYELGIVDAIAQAPLPNAPVLKKYYGIIAVLYKMNVILPKGRIPQDWELIYLQAFSAPSRLFKPHVDTPRSDTQFGSPCCLSPMPPRGRPTCGSSPRPFYELRLFWTLQLYSNQAIGLEPMDVD